MLQQESIATLTGLQFSLWINQAVAQRIQLLNRALLRNARIDQVRTEGRVGRNREKEKIGPQRKELQGPGEGSTQISQSAVK